VALCNDENTLPTSGLWPNVQQAANLVVASYPAISPTITANMSTILAPGTESIRLWILRRFLADKLPAVDDALVAATGDPESGSSIENLVVTLNNANLAMDTTSFAAIKGGLTTATQAVKDAIIALDQTAATLAAINAAISILGDVLSAAHAIV
jgi:hypothetical protein